jgi:ribosomal subunit interface protein
MRYTLNGKNIEMTPELRQYFESRIEKLDRLIPTFSEELVSLQGSIEQNMKRNDFSTSLALHFPQYTLHAAEQSQDVKRAMRAAFEDLIRQIDRFKRKLRGEHRWTSEKHVTNP